MAWPWLAIVAKNIPWTEIARRTPELIDSAGKLLEKRRGPKEGVPVEAAADLATRVEQLEQRDQDHARVIEAMAEQITVLTSGMEVLAARVRLLTWVIVVMAVTALVYGVRAG